MDRAGWNTRARDQSAQPPQSDRFEAQNDQSSVATQHPVHLAQYCVRPIAVVEGVRQQHRVNRVALDRELMHVSDGAGLAYAGLSYQRTTLGPCESHESAVFAPEAQLQAVLAEYTIERVLDHTRFLLQQRPAILASFVIDLLAQLLRPSRMARCFT